MMPILSAIERVGNALPHPGTLFALMALLVVVLSGIFASFDLVVTHPGTGELIRPVNLLSLEGLHRILTEMVTNFTGFAPLGTVLDRKSTRLNSSHVAISYAVFCLKKKKKI